MNLVILGKPGAGKGSLCEYFTKNSNITHLSTGDIFRAEIKAQTELGKLADSYISKGQLCPDEITNQIIYNILEKDPKKNYLFDGYPRTVNQANALDEMMNKLNIKLDAVIDMLVEDEIVIDRLSSRRVCSKCRAIYNTKTRNPKVIGVCDKCGGEVIIRDDDKIDAITKRLSVYENQTKPLINYYTNKGLILNVDGSLDSGSLFKVVNEKLITNKSLSSDHL